RSGTNKNGPVSWTSWTTARRFGGALAFNGASSIVTVPDSASLHLSTAVTLEAWIRPTTTGGWQNVIFKEIPGDGAYFLYRSGFSTAPVGGMFTTAEQDLPGSSSPDVKPG